MRTHNMEVIKTNTGGEYNFDWVGMKGNLISTVVFSGVVVGPATCILLADFISYILVVIVVIIASIALGIICKVRRDLKAIQDRLKNKRATSWGRVQEMMKKKEASSGVSQKPPFPTKTGWWMWHFRMYVFMLYCDACSLFVWNKSILIYIGVFIHCRRYIPLCTGFEWVDFCVVFLRWSIVLFIVKSQHWFSMAKPMNIWKWPARQSINDQLYSTRKTKQTDTSRRKNDWLLKTQQ